MADFYQLLAVSPGASHDELRAAYRRLLRRHHPDRFATGTPEHRHASAVTRALVAAWDVVGEPASRAAYDASVTGGPTCVSVPDPEPAPRATDATGATDATAAATAETTAGATTGVAAEPAPAPLQRRVEQRYVDAHGPARLREVRPVSGDPAVELLVRALRQAVAGAGGAAGQAGEDLRAAAVAEVAGVRSRATHRTIDRDVAAAALATASRELVARGTRPRPLLEAVAEQALHALGVGADSGVRRVAGAAVPAPRDGGTVRALRALTWVAGVVWVVLAARMLGEPQPSTGAWLRDVVVAAALGVVVVGPWWFLARALQPAAVAASADGADGAAEGRGGSPLAPPAPRRHDLVGSRA